jgi:hypothetical protein
MGRGQQSPTRVAAPSDVHETMATALAVIPEGEGAR